MSNQRIKISWEEFEKDIKALADSIPYKASTKILAVTRGGLVPAYFLARYLSVKLIRTLCITSYNKDNEQKDLKVIPASTEVSKRYNWLIVDDLIDTGKTLELAKKYYPNSKIAVLYKKPHSPDLVDYCVKEKDGWVCFPWE
jgi:xanthine phosphoribosyltransferase